MFDHFHGKTIFSKIDLIFGYHHVWIKDEDIFKIAFSTRYVPYGFVVMTFGLTNAPTNFMFMLNNIFTKYLYIFVLVFINNIVVYSKSKKQT